ncbi:MAG: phenylalanine--tRNA ligase subunit beta [Patescibacteria group bacterium]|nr:phenylalanine--tRNA ligase subunit beta [Patescibacteria group bacterium]
MKVSRLWLTKFFDTALPNAEALAEALTFHAFEIEGIETVRPRGSNIEDQVLDVKITPNRGHDALSHRGVAGELSAILNIPLAHDPLAQKPALLPKTDVVSVSIETAELCPRYIAGYIKNVKVEPSPQWLQDRLTAVGQRSINNIVDATNFVMFNLGQPLHAFDAGKLGSLDIGVRAAKDGEVVVVALDKKSYVLKDSMPVITAGGAPVGIAGVKGGMPAAIDETTKDIIIESANFDGSAVRRSAQALKLRTDASARFEQGLSPELAGFGMQAVAELIQKLADGELIGFVDKYNIPQKPSAVALSIAHARRLLGSSIAQSDIIRAFERLGFKYQKQDDTVTVEIPFQRLDLLIEEDLIEEAARIIGYDKIPAKELPPADMEPELNPAFYWSEKVREDLMTQGYSEVYTSVFADKGERIVLNKVDGTKPYLRSTLVENLKEALQKNIPNKYLLNLPEIKLFEIGAVWQGGKEEIMVGTVGEKEEAKEIPLSSYQKPLDQRSYYDELPLSQATRYQPFSKYPYIVRDIALWKPEGYDEHGVGSIITDVLTGPQSLGLRIFISGGTYFDKFEKEGRMSVAYRLIFQSFDRTLTEIEVNAIMDKISAALKEKGFEIR